MPDHRIGGCGDTHSPGQDIDQHSPSKQRMRLSIKIKAIKPRRRAFFSLDEKSVLSASKDEGFTIYDFPRIQNIFHFEEVKTAEYSFDDKKILTFSEDDKTAKIWDKKGNLIETLTGHDSRF